MVDPFRLDGVSVLVTGGTNGIGAAIATLFAERGAQVLVCGRKAERGAAFAAATGIEFVQADVTSDSDVRALVAAWGDLSVLVNNAGPTDLLHTRDVDGPVGEMTPENWSRILDSTLTSTYLMTHHCLPALVRSGNASIVNISSIAAAQAMPGFDAYSAGKASRARGT